MASRKFSIVIACLFVLGAFTWYGARFWTFGHVPASFAIPCVLAIALAVSQVRGSDSSRWLMLLFSGGGAYASFNLVSYTNARGIAAEAFLFPGVFFSLCAVLLVVSLLSGLRRTRKTAE